MEITVDNSSMSSEQPIFKHFIKKRYSSKRILVDEGNGYEENQPAARALVVVNIVAIGNLQAQLKVHVVRVFKE